MPITSIYRLARGAAGFVGILLFVPSAGAQASDTSALSTALGVYTAAQATRGQEIHGASCLSCHKPIETIGERFWNTIVGRPVAEFFSYLQTTMPQDNPGSLSGEDYAAVIAYIFSLNDLPLGETPLSADSVALSKITVAPLPPPARSLRTGKRR
ncbi:MAG: cytochrome c [Gemmatimonadota bacterium]|nr:cytochrome c [Gemmatimonadota bacterium]